MTLATWTPCGSPAQSHSLIVSRHASYSGRLVPDGERPNSSGGGATEGGDGEARRLHLKLLSPERMKKPPDELRQQAAAKQMRAERTRQVLDAERRAKLAKVPACVLLTPPLPWLLVIFV